MKPLPKRRPFSRKKPSPAGRAWNQVAQWYDQLVGQEGSEYQQQVVFPGALRLLALKPAERILDVACGQGAFCRLLNQNGAEVTGIDSSPELIRLARERSPQTPSDTKPPQYRIGDARELSHLPRESFHAATCLLAIQDIDKPAPLIQGAASALMNRGRFVLVMMHPAFRNPKHTSWGWDETNHIQFRRVDRYLLPRKEPIVTHPGKKSGEYTWTYHRPLQTYVKWLRNAGLFVETLEEWPSHKKSAPGLRAAAENQSREEIPLFLAIRAIKI